MFIYCFFYLSIYEIFSSYQTDCSLLELMQHLRFRLFMQRKTKMRISLWLCISIYLSIYLLCMYVFLILLRALSGVNTRFLEYRTNLIYINILVLVYFVELCTEIFSLSLTQCVQEQHSSFNWTLMNFT